MLSEAPAPGGQRSPLRRAQPVREVCWDSGRPARPSAGGPAGQGLHRQAGGRAAAASQRGSASLCSRMTLVPAEAKDRRWPCQASRKPSYNPQLGSATLTRIVVDDAAICVTMGRC
jgi:hypothetical protein